MPDSGSVKIGGVDANDRKQRHTAKMGFVFQENTLDLELSVQQNIRYFAGLYGLKNYQPRSESLLKEFGLWEQRADKAASLNGGHRRRLEIVRALRPNPDVLILDEPTSGLDPTMRQVILLEKSQRKEQGTFAELGGAQGIKSKFVAKEELLQL